MKIWIWYLRLFAFIRGLKFINPRFLLRKVIKDGGVHREVSNFLAVLPVDLNDLLHCQLVRQREDDDCDPP